MAGKAVWRRFVRDNRAVSEVVGFILIFALLVLLLAVYQVQIVPQQNAQTEFEHFEATQDELVDVRNSISTAGQTELSQFPSLKLGTTYQTRVLTINPPPATGTVQTSESYNITIANETDQTNVTTRFVEYQPGYNELVVGSINLEHSLLYLDERQRGNNVTIIEEQNLLKDGTVRLTAVQNTFQETGTDRNTLELYPHTEFTATEFPEPDDGRLNVSVPTRVTDDEYWDEALADSSVYQGLEAEEYDGETHALNLSIEETNLELNTVGIGSQPNENPAKSTTQHAVAGTNGSTGTFDKLVASIETRGDDRPDEVTIDDFEIMDGSETTFTATEARGDTAEVTVSDATGEPIVLDLGGHGNNRFPVTVVADIAGGECLEATFEDAGETSKSLEDEDWETCGS